VQIRNSLVGGRSNPTAVHGYLFRWPTGGVIDVRNRAGDTWIRKRGNPKHIRQGMSLIVDDRPISQDAGSISREAARHVTTRTVSDAGK